MTPSCSSGSAARRRPSRSSRTPGRPPRPAGAGAVDRLGLGAELARGPELHQLGQDRHRDLPVRGVAEVEPDRHLHPVEQVAAARRGRRGSRAPPRRACARRPARRRPATPTTACSTASSSPWPWVATTTTERCVDVGGGEVGAVDEVGPPAERPRPGRQACAPSASGRRRRAAAPAAPARCRSRNAPSLWQAIGITVMPSGHLAELLGRAEQQQLGPRRRRSPAAPRGCTTGSAQAPPIQPSSSPAAVMIAREPGWPDDGPCRHTTVARANSSPRRASSRARSRTSQPSQSASALTRRPRPAARPETSWRWVSAS